MITYKIEQSLMLIPKEYHLQFMEYLYCGVSTPEFHDYLNKNKTCQSALDLASKSNRGIFYGKELEETMASGV